MLSEMLLELVVKRDMETENCQAKPFSWYLGNDPGLRHFG